MRFIIEALNIPEEDVCYASYTGKAAEVLRKKGNKNSITLHRLLYQSHQMPDGSYVHIPKTSIEYSVIVVDECSMAPGEQIKLLLSHKVFVIFLGDPFQLPPIKESDNNHLLDNPHVFLDEIMRQAKESEIIRVSMDIRAGKPLTKADEEEVMILSPQDYDDSMLIWADQILVATNQTRININAAVRSMLGHDPAKVQDGDKIICLKNYWEICAGKDDNPLVNGTIGTIKNPYTTPYKLPPWWEGGKRIMYCSGQFINDRNDMYEGLMMDNAEILTGQRCIKPQTEYTMARRPQYKKLIPLEFTFGYAITVWKAQGSSWPKILLFEEAHPRAHELHQRFLYTALTRAEEKCVIIKKS